MISTEELFATESGWGRLHDCLVEAAGEPYDRSFSKEQVRAAWDRLPETVRDIAHCWGMETVFGDEAFVFFRDNPGLIP